MKKLADIVETNELPMFDQVVVMDEAPESVVVEEQEAKQGDYDKTQDLTDFLPWLQNKLITLPQHSGQTTSGCERIIAHLKMLDKEISKAITRDFDCLLDDTVVEKFRKDIRKMVKKLDKRHKEINDAYDADDLKTASSGGSVKTAEEILLPGELSKTDIGAGEAKPVEHKADDKPKMTVREMNRLRAKNDITPEEKKELELAEHELEKLISQINANRDSGKANRDLKDKLLDDALNGLKDSTRTLSDMEKEMAKKEHKADDMENDANDKTASSLRKEYDSHKASGNHAKAAEIAKKLHQHHSEELHGDSGKDEYHDKQQKKWWSIAKEHEGHKTASIDCACHIEKAAEVIDTDTCPSCRIQLWQASDSLMECIACDNVYTRKIVKEATTPRIQLVMSPFERSITGIIINAVVSNGRNAEKVYAELKKQYAFTDRDELSIQGLLQDMGYPVSRRFMGAVDNVNGKSVEFSTNYSA